MGRSPAPPPPPPPPHLPDLHHSADNHERSPHDIVLQYPSGATEHFSFGPRAHRRSHRYARPLSPIEDIIRTIEVICVQYGCHTKAELDTMRAIIRLAFHNRDHLASVNLPSLQQIINDVLCWHRRSSLGNPNGGQPPIRLCPEIIEHFFDQLHDRIISDDANLLERSRSSYHSNSNSNSNSSNNSTNTSNNNSKNHHDNNNPRERPHPTSIETTYGELTPPFLSKIFAQTRLGPGSIYIDLGSGVGQTCLQARLETQCRAALGVEYSSRVAAMAALHCQQFWARVGLWGLDLGEGVCGGDDNHHHHHHHHHNNNNSTTASIILRKGDFVKCAIVEEWLGRADVVLVNNLKLEPETDWALQGKLRRRLRVGARVVSTRPLVPIGRGRGMGKKKTTMTMTMMVNKRRKRKRNGGVEGSLLSSASASSASSASSSEDEDEEERESESVGGGKRRKVMRIRSLPTPPPEDRGVTKEEGLMERCGEDEVWSWHQYVYEAGRVSWSDKRGLYYISVKK